MEDIKLKFIQNNKHLRHFVFNYLSKPWARKKYDQIKSFLKNKDRIIDIGAGKCAISWLLRQNNFSVIPLDITNLSVVKNLKPIIYDGKQIPFPDNSFDKALLLTVLHHTHHPEQILKEAGRVAKEIIIIEDIYTNNFNKYLTYIMDSLMNFEFHNHPHNNKKESEWEKIFARLNMNIKNKKKNKALYLFKQIIYHLKCH